MGGPGALFDPCTSMAVSEILDERGQQVACASLYRHTRARGEQQHCNGLRTTSCREAFTLLSRRRRRYNKRGSSRACWSCGLRLQV